MPRHVPAFVLILFAGFCIGSDRAIARSVNLEALHLPYDGFCETVVQALKNYPPSTPDAAEANKRWWNGAMAAGGIPPYNIGYDHYRIIDEFFDACRPSPHTPIKPIMRQIGLQHRWILN
ncbi:MAG: hypothetical protein ABF876_01255 [Acetobacter aceti]|uniref:hypothetical protein n=1 Tax=Acetobacter aceti TaxID=435 RepID=UPI001F215C60|nr:hypothetical protein [Acetobacter aceti]